MLYLDSAAPLKLVIHEKESCALRSFLERQPAERVSFALVGKNTGPGGTGAHVKVSGRESWRFGDDGLVAESIGSSDSAEYERQLAENVLTAIEAA